MRLFLVAAIAAFATPAFAADPPAPAQSSAQPPTQSPAIPDTTSTGADKCDATLSFCLAGVGPNGTIVFAEAGEAKSKAGLASHTGILCNANTDSNAGGYVTESKAGIWGDRQNPTSLAAGKCVPISASALELHMTAPNTPWNAIWVASATPAPAKPVVHHAKKPKIATTLPGQTPAPDQAAPQLQPDAVLQPSLPQ